MNFLVVCTLGMGADDGDIIAGIADIVIGEKFRAMLGNISAHRLQHTLRRANMAAYRADIRFDYADRDFHWRSLLRKFLARGEMRLTRLPERSARLSFSP